jgi:hypothetical protein
VSPFEESLVALIERRVEASLAAFARHSREQDAGKRSQLLGDAQMHIATARDHVRALVKLHEMHREMEEARG